MPTSRATQTGERHVALPARAPSWLAILLLLNAIMLGALSATRPHDSDWSMAIYAALGGVPYIAIGIMLRSWPRPLVYGALAAAQGMAVLSAMLLLVILSTGWSDARASTGALAGGRVVLLGVGIVQVVGLLWAIAAIRDWPADGAAREAWRGVLALIACQYVAGIAAASAAGAMDHALYGAGEKDQLALTRNVVRIQRCAIQYAKQHPDAGYPRQLAALGPKGTRCLERDDIAATHRRYTLTYRPDEADDNDRTPSFVVQGVTRANAQFGSFGIWADTSATQRRRRLLAIDERPAPGDSVPAQLVAVQRCVEAMRADGHLPATVAELADAAKQLGNRTSYASQGCRGAPDGATGVRWLDDAFVTRTGYRMLYTALGAGYRIDARPAEFGATAIRSYMAIDTGLVHFTTDDRAATVNDSGLPLCAPYGVGDCTPTPLSTLPQAQFLHPASVSVDHEYTLRIGVVGDLSSAPSGLWWAFECNVTPSDGVVPTPPRRQVEMQAVQSCPRPRNARPVPGDSLVVRLWLRSETGAITHVDHTIRVTSDSIPPRSSPPDVR